MRILHVINTLTMGGAERLVVWLSHELARRGLSVAVLSLGPVAKPFATELRADEVQLFNPRVGGPRSPLGILAVTSAVRQFAPDVVHAHLFPAQFWAALGVRRKLGRPKMVVTEHSTWNRRRVRWWGPSVDAYVYDRCDHVICISEAVQQALAVWRPSVSGRLDVVPNGIPLRPVANRTGTGPAGGGLRVAYAGRLVAVKGVDVLVEAVAAAKEFRLVVAGDGVERERLKVLAEALGVADRVTFLGEVANIGEALGACDVYVQPSRVEGFSIAALEAMAMGLPVVVSDVPGLRETVGDAALRFRPGDSAELVARLQSLAASPELRQRLAARSVERARAFDIARTASGYVAVYQKVLQA